MGGYFLGLFYACPDRQLLAGACVVHRTPGFQDRRPTVFGAIDARVACVLPNRAAGFFARRMLLCRIQSTLL